MINIMINFKRFNLIHLIIMSKSGYLLIVFSFKINFLSSHLNFNFLNFIIKELLKSKIE